MNPVKIQSSNLYRTPSFMKGMSRVVDIFGKLDEYHYESQADSKALSKDWAITGVDLQTALNKYPQKK